MSAVEFIDQDRNFERLDIQMDIPNLGYGLIQEYIDLNNQLLTTYIPSIDLCQKYTFPYKFNLKEVFDEFENPTKGFVTYLGVQTLAWDSSVSKHVYLMESPVEDLKATNEFLYFNLNDLKISGAKMVNNNMVINIPQG
jgi:hypothetical protein